MTEELNGSEAGQLGSEGFFRMIRGKVHELLQGYIAALALREEIESYIVRPELGDNAGICGALSLAHDALP